MARGRPPKSLIEKLSSGDPGKRIPAAEMRAFERGQHPIQVKAKAKPITPPKSLTPAALLIWKEVVGGHIPGTYLATDRRQLQVYCEAVATFEVATQMLATEGYVATGSSGQTVTSPWVAIQREAGAKIDKIGPTLFLTPVAREAMKIKTVEDGHQDEFHGLIN